MAEQQYVWEGGFAWVAAAKSWTRPKSNRQAHEQAKMMSCLTVRRLASSAAVLAEELLPSIAHVLTAGEPLKHSNAYLAGRNPPGLLEMPEALQAAIASLLKGYPRRHLKEDAARISELYRSSCQIKADALLNPPAVTTLGKRKNNVREQETCIPLDYGEREAVAYVATQMPFAFSIAERVFCEIQRRCSDFTPETVLDFGSGPGSALW